MSTALLSSMTVALIAIVILSNFSTQFSFIVFKTTKYRDFFNLVYAISFLELSKEIFLAFIRAREKSFFYVLIAIVQLLTQVGFNIYFILGLKLGVLGILWGNLLSVGIVWLILACTTFMYCGLRFDVDKFRLMSKYCFPFFLAAIGGIVINNADRIMLNNYAGLAIVTIS